MGAWAHDRIEEIREERTEYEEKKKNWYIMIKWFELRFQVKCEHALIIFIYGSDSTPFNIPFSMRVCVCVCLHYIIYIEKYV